MDFSFKLARNGLRRVCVDPDGGDPPVLYHAPCIGRSGWSAATAAPCGVHLPVRARARATEQRSTSRRPSQPARDLDFSRELWTFDVGDGGGGGAHA